MKILIKKIKKKYEMILFEKKIILSSKTKSFYDLTEKNKEYKNEFIELAKRFFNYDEDETEEEYNKLNKIKSIFCK